MEVQTVKSKTSGKRYDEQFKKDTVAYWLKNKKTAKEVSAAFEVSEAALYDWRKRYEFDSNDPSRSIEAELDRLRKENTELRQERDILKKSVAIFLKPQR